MDSKRQEKFARLIQKDLGELFQQASREWFGGAFITVSGAKVAPDLGYVKIYLSFFGVENKQALLDEVNFRNKELRKRLALRIKNQIRKIPELSFYLDESQEYVQHMDEVFKKLEQEKQGAGQQNPE
jgi:ribosome-binding factor A